MRCAVPWRRQAAKTYAQWFLILDSPSSFIKTPAVIIIPNQTDSDTDRKTTTSGLLFRSTVWTQDWREPEALKLQRRW